MKAMCEGIAPKKKPGMIEDLKEIRMVLENNNENLAEIDQAIAKLDTLIASLDGKTVVPEEPTQKMLEAGEALDGTYYGIENLPEIYKAMIEAGRGDVRSNTN